MRKSVFLLAGASTLVSACATLPANVGIDYFHPKLDATLTVSETITCDKANHVIAAASATPTTVYSAGELASPLILDSLRGDLADTKLTFDFTDDGRLKDINSSSTGEGEAVLTTAVKLVTDVAAAGAALYGLKTQVAIRGVRAAAPDTFPQECAEINKWAKGDPITLTYSSPLTFAEIPPDKEGTQAIEADAGSTPRYNILKGAIGVVCASVGPPVRSAGMVQNVHSTKGYINGPRVGWLQLKQPASVTVRAYIQRAGDCAPTDGRKFFWAGAFAVPQLGHIFYVPIPRAEVLGNHTFALNLSDSGEITKLEYDTDTGAKSVATVATSVGDQLTPASRAQMYDDARKEKAARDQWLACLADATKCPDSK